MTVVLATWASTQAQAPAALPTPALHHVSLNVVDPAKSQQFYKTIWPQGEITTLAGMPVYKSDMYILLMRVSTLAGGTWDMQERRSLKLWRGGRGRITHLPKTTANRSYRPSLIGRIHDRFVFGRRSASCASR